jgi:hypothetical protein
MTYTDNGQTYNIHILYYFLVLHIAGGGGSAFFWPAGQLAPKSLEPPKLLPRSTGLARTKHRGSD